MPPQQIRNATNAPSTGRRESKRQRAAQATDAVDSGVENQQVDERTVEDYLKERCEAMAQDIQNRADHLIGQLRQDYERQAAQLRGVAAATTEDVAAARHDLTLTAGSLEGAEAESEYAGQEWLFEDMKEGQVVPIGRSKIKKFRETGLSLPKDGGVSTKHANVVLREGRLWYTDLGSSNGTELNGAEVPEHTEVELEDGAVLAIGDTQLTVFFKVQMGASSLSS
jgi:hypothetical protein